MVKFLFALLLLITIVGLNGASIYRLYYPPIALEQTGPSKDATFLHDGHIVLEKEHIMIYEKLMKCRGRAL